VPAITRTTIGMKIRIATAAALAVLAACASAPPAGGGAAAAGTPAPAPARNDAPASDALSRAAATITAEEMRTHVAYLASDALRGRDTPSPGLDSAAAYLIREFERLGLEGGAGAGLFAQRYRIEGGTAPNVVAVFPGADPALRGEYVVLSAHIDHVGVGAPVRGDSIYNGADDDASGTSALLEVAEAFAALERRPARSIVFLGVSGEEKGLLGSEYFTEHPTLPLANVVANLNVDMIGRNDPANVVVIGRDYSSLGDVLAGVVDRNPSLGLGARDDPWPEERFFFRSDHFNFARKRIPILFFFAGVHADYHRPSDQVEKLDVDKAARVARLVFLTAHAVADDPRRPTWTPKGLREVRAATGPLTKALPARPSPALRPKRRGGYTDPWVSHRVHRVRRGFSVDSVAL
jgi:hypothetical protein